MNARLSTVVNNLKSQNLYTYTSASFDTNFQLVMMKDVYLYFSICILCISCMEYIFKIFKGITRFIFKIIYFIMS